jgi:hypothetical protein
MRGNYEVRQGDALRCHGVRIKFHKVWFRHSKVKKGGYTDIQTEWSSHKPTFISQNEESKLKIKLNRL